MPQATMFSWVRSNSQADFQVAEVMRETPTARLPLAPSPRQRLLSAEIEIRTRYKAMEQAIGSDEG